jgi:hypothetical protein
LDLSAHETVDGSPSITAEQTPSMSLQKLLRSWRLKVLQQFEPSKHYKIPEGAKEAVSALLVQSLLVVKSLMRQFG